MKQLLIGLVLLIAQTQSKAQAPATEDRIKVFIECTREWLCDFDYLRTELKMVDFVRDRFLADIHVIVNSQSNSNGSEQNTVTFKGQGRFTGKNDTLIYHNNAVAMDDEKRKNMVKYVSLGLTSYLIHTPALMRMSLAYTAPDKKEADDATTKKDPWNYWVMSVGSSAFFNGDANYKSTSIYSYINADRETNKSKVNIGFSHSYKKNEIKISETEKVIINNPKINLFGNVIRKFNEHWGAGVFSSYTQDIFSNIDNRLSFAPKIEYDIFPYSKFNNERLVLQYAIGPEINDYADTTFYFKTKETVWQQQAALIGSFNKPWGNINAGMFYSAYMDNLRKYSLSFSGSVNWRIFKGFRLGFGGNYDITRNLISIPKGSASRDDVLTQRRLLNSGYNYFFGIGFSYQFGSKFNNFINPAFKGLSWSLNF